SPDLAGTSRVARCAIDPHGRNFYHPLQRQVVTIVPAATARHGAYPMSEQKDLEQNALASRLNRVWTNFKQGKLISYKVMAIILLRVAGIGLWWYISVERSKNTSKQWVDFDEAFSLTKLEEIAKLGSKAPTTSKLAELLIARAQLGPEGIEQLASLRPEGR